jgi:hypothetical protein
MAGEIGFAAGELILDKHLGPTAVEHRLAGVFEEALMDEVWPGPAPISLDGKPRDRDGRYRQLASRRKEIRSQKIVLRYLVNFAALGTSRTGRVLRLSTPSVTLPTSKLYIAP